MFYNITGFSTEKKADQLLKKIKAITKSEPVIMVKSKDSTQKEWCELFTVFKIDEDEQCNKVAIEMLKAKDPDFVGVFWGDVKAEINQQ